MIPVFGEKEYNEAVRLYSPEAIAREAVAMMESHDREVLVVYDDSLCGQVGQAIARLLLEAGVSCRSIHAFLESLPKTFSGLILDCLMEQREEAPALIDAMEGLACPIISLFIPYGLSLNNGFVCSKAVHAQSTLSFGGCLQGLFLGEGLAHCGQIVPFCSMHQETILHLPQWFSQEDARRCLPPRKRTAHKGTSGKALLCVGSPEYVGAAILACKACLAAGCGILYAACPQIVRQALFALPEAITIAVGEEWSMDAAAVAAKAMENKTAIGIGCGLGKGEFGPLLEAALRLQVPMVLDADGINYVSRHRELYSLLHEKVILTPHPGEMSRLTGTPIAAIADDPIGSASSFANKWNCTVLLKGTATVVSDGKQTRIIAEGNAGLAKGGSGDVLTGIITGLLAQGIGTLDAACLGSWLLGVSADEAMQLLGERMLRATNVIEALEQI